MIDSKQERKGRIIIAYINYLLRYDNWRGKHGRIHIKSISTNCTGKGPGALWNKHLSKG